MIVNGVGRNGKNVNVDDDFLIHIPYGWCYDIDENALEDEQVFMLFHPENMSNKYTDGRFDLEDDTNCEAILKFIHMSSIAIPEDATELDIDINKTLKQMSVNAKNTTINTIFGGIFGDEDDDNKDKFHRMYEVVKDNPFLKVGYFTSGLLGRTVYNVILITSHYVYTAMQIKFPEDNCDNNQKILNEILSAIEPLNVKKYPKFDEQKPFLQPSYLKKHNVKVGSLTMMIPDGFEYVTENHIPQNDSKAKNVLDNYTMVVAPADCKGGLRNFRDASLGINISKAEESGLTVSAWKNIDAIKEGLNSNNQEQKFKYIKEGTNYLIGYRKGNECKAGDESYWVSYFVVIFCGALQYTCNMFFNSKKANDAEYNKAVETFCLHIQSNADDLREAEVNQLREELGDMLAKNGRLNAILASQLYTKDVIFNNDNEVFYDGTHTIITGFQLNATVIDAYAGIMNHVNAFIHELNRLVSYVEQNENLMIPKSKFHPNILNATRGNPITGATVFELCAWHMLLIAESDKNKYKVAIDNNLIKGIPDAFMFVGEFIRTLRAYNEIYDDFEITYVPTLNIDEPCGSIISPVRGAVTKSATTIKINGISNTNTDEYAIKLKEIDSVTDEDYTRGKLQQLEENVNLDIIKALKIEAKNVKVLFEKISATIKAKNYNGLSDIDAVIEKVNEAIDESTDIMDFNLTYMYRPFINSYEIEYISQKVVSDTDFNRCIHMVITENIFDRSVFDPNEFPKRLSYQMDNLTETAIYIQFLEDVNYLIKIGNQIISTLSNTYIQKVLYEWENDFEVQGTQYEGRSNRIENIKVGDKLTLKREPDNEYDSNAIDLRTPIGSVGHLPAHVAKLLSPAIDAETITAVAEVIKAEPLSMRSKKAKKPLLNVKVVTTSKENYDEEKESKTNPEEKKRLEDEIMKKANEDDKQKKVAETKKNEQKEEIVLILKKQGDYNGLTPLEIQRSSDKLMQFSLHKISGLLGELREEGKITQYEDAKGRVISVIAVTNKETDDSKKETKFNLEEEKQLKYDAVKKIKESNERKKVAETEKNEQKEEIVLILKKQGDYNGLTPLEIQRSSDKLMQFSLHKISGLLRELREEGKIIQYEDAKGRVISQLV